MPTTLGQHSNRSWDWYFAASFRANTLAISSFGFTICFSLGLNFVNTKSFAIPQSLNSPALQLSVVLGVNFVSSLNLTWSFQVCLANSQALRDRPRYPKTVQMYWSEDSVNPARVAFINYMKWTKVAIIFEDIEYFRLVSLNKQKIKTIIQRSLSYIVPFGTIFEVWDLLLSHSTM